MPEMPESIEDLRRQIDEIDTALHDLLMRRTEVANRIGVLKGNHRANGSGEPSLLRPAREAAVLRRLLERHRGSLPPSTVVRLWRELMSALLRLQGPFAVAVCAPERIADRGNGAWDLAREHFGTGTPLGAHESPRQVLRAVTEGEATVGVLPLPEEDGAEPWWRNLLSHDPRTPRIFARLPFCSEGNGAAALAVGRVAHEPSGADHTLAVIEMGDATTRSGLRRELEGAGLRANEIQVWEEGPTSFHLVEIDGFVAEDDPRLAGIAAGDVSGKRRVWIIGGYAVLPRKSAPLARRPNAAVVRP